MRRRTEQRLLWVTAAIVALSVCGRAQSLENTAWITYDQAWDVNVFFHFGVDTISFSETNTVYTNISTFEDNSGTFRIVDLSVNTCPLDTGIYSYVIQSDTLYWTLIGDICSSRASVFVDYYWVSIPMGTYDREMPGPMVIFPNPVDRDIHIASAVDLSGKAYILTNGWGTTVCEGRFTGSVNSIDVAHLSAGTYFLRVDELRSIRIIKL